MKGSPIFFSLVSLFLLLKSGRAKCRVRATRTRGGYTSGAGKQSGQVSLQRVSAPGRVHQWRAGTRGDMTRARQCDARRGAGGMWCSGGARCGGGWRRPARPACPTPSCGAWRARSTPAPPPPSASPPTPACGWRPPAPTGSPTCATSASSAARPTAPSTSAATLTTGAASASPVRAAVDPRNKWNKHCPICALASVLKIECALHSDGFRVRECILCSGNVLEVRHVIALSLSAARWSGVTSLA